MSVYVIAEIGPNHCGSVETAMEMIRRLAPCGVDAVKFQLSNPDNLFSKDAFKAEYQDRIDSSTPAAELSRKNQLPRDGHAAVEACCKEHGVDYLCTAFDLDSLRFLDETFDMPFFKIASGEIHTLDMLDYMAERTRPILLSTGMATFDEIQMSLDVLCRTEDRDVTVLHCVSNYPAPAEDINLNVIPALRDRFARPVGFSDHSLGPECCLGAVALGAVVIEKHVTMDRGLDGPDHQASATIEEFAELVASIRTLASARGDGHKVFSAAEDAIRRVARKSIVARHDIEHGTLITAEDIAFKRPGTGLSPLLRERVIGAKAARKISGDRVIVDDDLGSPE